MMSSKSISREAPGNSTTRAEGSTREPVDSDPHALTHAIIATARADRTVGRRKRLNNSRQRRHSPLSAASLLLVRRLTCEAYLREPLRARAVGQARRGILPRPWRRTLCTDEAVARPADANASVTRWPSLLADDRTRGRERLSL